MSPRSLKFKIDKNWSRKFLSVDPIDKNWGVFLSMTEMASGLTETPLLPLLGATRRDSSAFVPQNCNTNQFPCQITCLNSPLACNIPSALPFCLLSVIAFHVFLVLHLPILHPFCPFLFLLVSCLLSPFLLAVFSFPFLSVSFPCSLPVKLPFSPLFPLLRFFFSLFKNNPNRGVEMFLL